MVEPVDLEESLEFAGVKGSLAMVSQTANDAAAPGFDFVTAVIPAKCTGYGEGSDSVVEAEVEAEAEAEVVAEVAGPDNKKLALPYSQMMHLGIGIPPH